VRKLALSCIAAILCGAALITGPGLHGGDLDPRGLAWAVPAPLIYAVYLAINARLLRRHPALIGATGLFAGMAVTFGLIAAWLGLNIPGSAGGWALLLFVGLGPGAVTMTLFTYSVPRLGASSFAILANTELIVVVSLGVLVLGEALTPFRAIGGALIVAGVVTHALARRPVPPPQAGEARRRSLPARAEPAG
jgi:drug/metabolite transporter (DMT)-like permease